MMPVRVSRTFHYLCATLCLCLALGTHYLLHQKFQMKGSAFTQMLYLPSGTYLKAVAFGYHALLADIIYLWSIQYYGEPGFHPRMEYLEHTYNIITELDPQYLDAYEIGALFMASEGGNPAASLRLLDRGIQKNPSEWILPTSAGFFCILTLNDRKRSIEYFQKASRIPGAPSITKRMTAGLYFQLGDKKVAYKLWKEVYETADTRTVKQTAFQQMHDLKVLIDLEEIRNAIDRFRSVRNRNPLNLNQLASSGIVQQIPLDPNGNPYEYDPKNGTVRYSSDLKIYKRYQ